MIFWLITIFLLLPYLFLLLYYRQGWVEMKNYVPSKPFTEAGLPFVSIIIAARDEEKNIGNCIRSIINQTYPQTKFEIIIINDHSTDNTVSIINSFQKENILILNLADYTKNEILNSYKKKSIETAMQFAKGNLIVTTDADCMVPERWLETIAFFYKEKKPVFIAAPVIFSPSPPGEGLGVRLLKIFQSLDFITLQGITGSSVHKKFHSMCNGANLAYEKKIFYEVNGFENIDTIASGDDMLLMYKIQKIYPHKIEYIKSSNVIVQTQPAQNIKEFISQRIRWASKADKYSDKKITAALLLVYLLNAWIFILGISSFFVSQIFYLFLIALIIKIFMELIFLFPIAIFFKKQKLLWWFVPSQPFHIIYILIAGWLGRFGSYKWKGRKVK